MGMPNPSSMVRRQTEAINNQFDAKKTEVMGQIGGSVAEQIAEIRGKEKDQLQAVDAKIQELERIKSSLSPDDPGKAQIAKQVGILRQQRKQVVAQSRLAVAAVRANAAREKENIKTRLEREKTRALRQAVEMALSQFSMLMAQRRAAAEGPAGDELRSGNRG